MAEVQWLQLFVRRGLLVTYVVRRLWERDPVVGGRQRVVAGPQKMCGRLRLPATCEYTLLVPTHASNRCNLNNKINNWNVKRSTSIIHHNSQCKKRCIVLFIHALTSTLLHLDEEIFTKESFKTNQRRHVRKVGSWRRRAFVKKGWCQYCLVRKNFVTMQNQFIPSCRYHASWSQAWEIRVYTTTLVLSPLFNI